MDGRGQRASGFGSSAAREFVNNKADAGQIGAPIRGILGNQTNTTVVLGEVIGVDREQRCLFVNSVDREGVRIHYDYLILATGAQNSYLGMKNSPDSRQALKAWRMRSQFAIKSSRHSSKRRPRKIRIAIVIC
jgi:NADH dehydrogenase FAD-containing subunit